MSKCVGNIELKLGRGEDVGNYYDDERCSTVILKSSSDNKKIGSYPTHFYFFASNNGSLNKNNLNERTIHRYFSGKKVESVINVEKDDSDKLKLTLCSGDRCYSIEKNEIEGNIDLQKYVETKETIYVKQEEGSRIVYLYNIQGNKIGNLIKDALIINTNEDPSGNPGSLHVLRYTGLSAKDDVGLNGNGRDPKYYNKHYEDEIEFSISKENGKYQTHLVDQDSALIEIITKTIDSTIDYNVLDKMIEEKNLYCKIEELCKELDNISLEIDRTHHSCVNNILSHNALTPSHQEELCKELDATSMALSRDHHPCASSI